MDAVGCGPDGGPHFIPHPRPVGSVSCRRISAEPLWELPRTEGSRLADGVVLPGSLVGLQGPADGRRVYKGLVACLHLKPL